MRRSLHAVVAFGIAADVLTTDPSGRLPEAERLASVKVRRFPTLRRDQVYFVSPLLARWLFRHGNAYDLIHVHSYHTGLGLEAASVSRLIGVPYVISPHYTALGIHNGGASSTWAIGPSGTLSFGEPVRSSAIPKPRRTGYGETSGDRFPSRRLNPESTSTNSAAPSPCTSVMIEQSSGRWTPGAV